MKFSENYVEAREHFIQAAENAGFRVSRFRVPYEESPDLFIDLALLRRNPKSLLLHISGVHGVEGYAGSAVQEAILSETFTAEGPSILLVHALNPFGMAFFRRNNGENVDLNRNFILDRSKVKNPNYRFFHSYLNPNNRWQYYFGLLQAWIHFKRLGLSESSAAIAKGQKDFPGLFYAGERTQREISLLLDYLKNNFKDVETVFGLDVHTGLGEFAQESLFVNEAQEPKGTKYFDSVFQRSIDIEDPAKGLYTNIGPLSDAIRSLFPKAQVHFVVQEFGTYPAIHTLGALRKQNLVWKTPKEDSAVLGSPFSAQPWEPPSANS